MFGELCESANTFMEVKWQLKMSEICGVMCGSWSRPLCWENDSDGFDIIVLIPGIIHVEMSDYSANY